MNGLGLTILRSAVDVERFCGGLAGESLADHDLEDISGADVFAAAFDGVAETVFGEVGLHLR
jgi:hypothetical protein